MLKQLVELTMELHLDMLSFKVIECHLQYFEP